MRRPKFDITTAIATVGLLLVTSACAKGGEGGRSGGPDEEGGMVGYDDPSSSDMAKIPPALEDGDVAGVQARGMTIWRMQRAMRLGDRAFAGFVGVTAAKFVAIASIDPGDTSGQVAYYRWDAADLEDGEATADEARNWVVVPLTLDPDEVMEPQELSGMPDAEQRRTIAALVLAQASAEAEYSGARWVAYCFREQSMRGGEPTGARQTRIYLLGADEKSPDVEYLIHDQLKRKQPLTIAHKQLHLAGEGASKLPLTTPALAVGPTTVARAVAIATATKKPVQIVDGAGTTWEVAGTTGALTKL